MDAERWAIARYNLSFRKVPEALGAPHMPELKFQVMIGSDGIIRPPLGIALVEGEAEVTVRPLPASVLEPVPDSMAPTRAWLLEMAREAEMLDPDLPSDLAKNHDHYAHGKPLP